MSGERWRAGGCHCGAVRFEVLAPDAIEVEDCNCTICLKSGFLHLIVPQTNFRTLSGGDTLTRYTFGTGVAQHLFCPVCGVKAYYVPRSNPEGVSVNLRCLDEPEAFAEIRITGFDGRNDWERAALSIAAKA